MMIFVKGMGRIFGLFFQDFQGFGPAVEGIAVDSQSSGHQGFVAFIFFQGHFKVDLLRIP